MNLLEIEKLLDKYFEGETSLAEEQQLREFFTSGNIPEKWKNLEGFFTYISLEKEQMLTDPGFDDKVMASVRESRMAKLIDLHRPWIYWIAGAAASILILVAVFVKFDPFTNKIEDTYKDPQTAYFEAKKILLFVSTKFNQGTKNLEPVTALETGLDQLKPVSAAFTQAKNNVERLDEVEKVKKMITNN
jgi:hypothetical protein